MIWHNHVRADPRSMQGSFFPKTQKSFVDCRRCQNIATILRAGGDEVNRRPYEHKVKPTQALFPNFGAHTAPLQRIRFTASVSFSGFA